jgi:soluble cytochrome b562
MKLRHLLFAFGSLLLVAPGLRADPKTEKEAAKPAKSDEDQTELGDKMDKMNGAFRKLKKQLPDPASNASSLEQVAILRQYAEEAIKLTPAKAADIPEANRAKFVADYQAGMKKTLELIGNLEAALKANKNDEAQKVFAELGAAQKEGHKQFKRPKS